MPWCLITLLSTLKMFAREDCPEFHYAEHVSVCVTPEIPINAFIFLCMTVLSSDSQLLTGDLPPLLPT